MNTQWKKNGDHADKARQKQITTMMEGFPSYICHWQHMSLHWITWQIPVSEGGQLTYQAQTTPTHTHRQTHTSYCQFLLCLWSPPLFSLDFATMKPTLTHTGSLTLCCCYSNMVARSLSLSGFCGNGEDRLSMSIYIREKGFRLNVAKIPSDPRHCPPKLCAVCNSWSRGRLESKNSFWPGAIMFLLVCLKYLQIMKFSSICKHSYWLSDSANLFGKVPLVSVQELIWVTQRLIDNQSILLKRPMLGLLHAWDSRMVHLSLSIRTGTFAHLCLPTSVQDNSSPLLNGWCQELYDYHVLYYIQ